MEMNVVHCDRTARSRVEFTVSIINTKAKFTSITIGSLASKN